MTHNDDRREAGEDHGERPDRNRIHGYIQLAFVILFIGGAFLLSRCLASLQTSPGPGRQTGERELLVETERISPRSVRLTFTTTGTVQVRAMTQIVPQVSGRVVAIDDSAFPGGLFTADTILFEIEKADFRLEIERMKADVARARTQLELQQERTRAAIADWRQLHPGEAVPSLVAQKPQLKEARAALQAARSRLKVARLNLSRTDFHLPFTGRITEFRLELGQYAVAGQAYGQAYRLASLEIDVPLEEKQLDWLLETDDPLITVTSGYREQDQYTGYVKRVSGKRDPDTRFARVILGLKETRPDLVPDVFVTVRVVGPTRENVWSLPLNALQENESIWAVTPENRLTSLRPEILQITEEQVVARSNGEAVWVVRGDLSEATEGTPVRLASPSGNGGQDQARSGEKRDRERADGSAQ